MSCLACIPLFAEGRAFGGLYFAPASEVEWPNVRDVLLVSVRETLTY